MDIRYENNTDVQTYFLRGRLDQSNYRLLESFIAENYDNSLDVCLNLEQLDYTSSVGLRVFIILARKVLANDQKIYAQLANGSDVEKILKLSGLDKLIPFS